MRNKFLSAFLLLILFCCVACWNIDDKFSNYYSVRDDGSWVKGRTSQVLEGTDKPYIAVIKNGQPSEVVSLSGHITNVTIGVGTVTVDGSGITYTNTSDSAQIVYIRTNQGKLTVNGKTGNSSSTSDEIYHYGHADEIIVNVGEYCFYTHAMVKTMTIEKGKAIADKNGFVSLVEAKENTKVEEKNGGIVIIPQTVTTEVINKDVSASLGYQFNSNQYTPSTQREEKIKKSGYYTISSEEELIAFRDNYNNGSISSSDIKKIVLTQDITLTEEWIPIGTWEYPFNGTFDGNGHTISGLKPANPTTVAAYGDTTGPGEVFGFIGIVGDTDGNTENDVDVCISNISFAGVDIQGYTSDTPPENDPNLKNVGVVIGFAPTSEDFSDTKGKGGQYAPNKWTGNSSVGKTSIVIENVKVSGKIDVQAHVGGVIGKLYDEATAVLKDCTSDMVITSYNNGGLAGFIGYCRNSKAIFDGCSFTSKSELIYAGEGKSVYVGDYCSGEGFSRTVKNKISNNPKVKMTFTYQSIKNLINTFYEELTVLNIKSSNRIINYGDMVLVNCISGEYINNYGTMTVINGTHVRIHNFKDMIINGASAENVFNGGEDVSSCNLIINNGSINTFTTKSGSISTVNGGSFGNITNHGIVTINNCSIKSPSLYLCICNNSSTKVFGGNFSGLYEQNVTTDYSLSLYGGTYKYNTLLISHCAAGYKVTGDNQTGYSVVEDTN